MSPIPEVDQDRLVVVFDDPQFESYTTGSTPGQKEDLQKTWPVLTEKMTNVITDEVDALAGRLSGTYTESERKEKFDDELADIKDAARNTKLYEAARLANISHPKDGHDSGVTTAYIRVTLIGDDDDPRVEGKLVLWVQRLGQKETKLLHFKCWRPYRLSLGSGENDSIRSKGDTGTPEISFSDDSRNFSERTVLESNKDMSFESARTSKV
jgi:hypothetical protein